MGTSRTRTFDCPVCFEEMKPPTSSQPSGISSLLFGKSNVKVKTEERSHYIFISTPDASQYRWKAAECLGQYQVAGNHDGTVYYQQLHTVDTVDYTIYCYRQAGKWWASQRLGAEYGNLCCEEGGPYPPARGWRYMYGSWRDDPLLSVQDGLSLCQGATVSVSGNTELSQDIAGEYFLVAGQYRLGRVMMKHRSKDRFLVFWHGWAGGSWRVEDKVSDGSSSVIAFSLGGRMTVCPGQDNNTKWWDNRRIGYATVTVKCHTHN